MRAKKGDDDMDRMDQSTRLQSLTVAIAGLGLIGGSMAMALRRHSGCRVLGIDRDPGVLQAARERKAVHAVGGPELLREEIGRAHV